MSYYLFDTVAFSALILQMVCGSFKPSLGCQALTACSLGDGVDPPDCRSVRSLGTIGLVVSIQVQVRTLGLFEKTLRLGGIDNLKGCAVYSSFELLLAYPHSFVCPFCPLLRLLVLSNQSLILFHQGSDPKDILFSGGSLSQELLHL